MWIFFFCVCALIKCYDTKAVQRSTVLETMLKDPVLKNCNSSLLDDSAATFIERCNIQYKSDIINVDEREQLLCLGYYDINRRLCERKKIFLPHNATELNILYSNIAAQNLSCEVMNDKLAFGNLSHIKNYATTLKTYFSDITVCKKMCYTLRDDLDEFCKILFWGNLLLSSPETQTGGTTPYKTNGDLSGTLAQRLHQENLETLLKPKNSDVMEYVSQSGEENTNQNVQPSIDLSVKKNNKTLADPSNNQPLVEELNGQLMKNEDSSLLGIKKDNNVSETSGVQVVETVVHQRDEESATIPTPHEEKTISKESPSKQEEKSNLLGSDHPDQVIAGVADIYNKKKDNPEENKILEANKNDLSLQDGDLEDNFGGSRLSSSGLLSADDDDHEYAQQKLQSNNDEDPLQNIDGESQEETPRKPIEPPRSPENTNVMITQTLDSNSIQNQDNSKNFNEVQNKDHKNGYITGSLPVDEDAEEGHFFPMFLTLVGLSALMYILFHNKNKILGLLVEGRVHSTRRRGSHAYSRLNTLEHAVASPAPPAHKATILY